MSDMMLMVQEFGSPSREKAVHDLLQIVTLCRYS